MEQQLCEAAIDGDRRSLDEILSKDRLILDKIIAGCCIACPLHVAASHGRTNFVKHLLGLNPELAEVLDPQLRSALHLAAAKGHVEVVQALIDACPEMCLTRDRDGRNPLHIAAIKGRIGVLRILVHKKPHAARNRVDGGDTILHLCVKHGQLETLELLLGIIKGPEFVNAKDGGGNTVLHVAVSDQQLEMVKYVLERNNQIKIDVNATNTLGQTALDILLLAQDGHESQDSTIKTIENHLRRANAKKSKDLVQSEWLTKKRDSMMVVASLIATMAFQAGVSPPGGVWQDDSNGHRAGETVMAYNYSNSYPYFLRANTIGFVASLSTILLLISGLPFRKRAYMWCLVVIMWLTITSMAFTYAFAITVVTPKKDRNSLSSTIVVGVIVWCSVMAVLLLAHTARLVKNFVEEKRNKSKAIASIYEFSIGKRCRKVDYTHSMQLERVDSGV